MNRLLHGRTAAFAALLALASAAPLHAADDVKALLAAVKAVRSEGAGNPAASAASRALARLGPEALPAILGGFDDDNPVATNWLRAAADAVGERALKDKKSLPAAELEKFL